MQPPRRVARHYTTEMMDTEVGRGKLRQMQITIMYGRYLRFAVACILKVTWDVVKDVRAAEFYSDGMEDK